MLLSDLNAMTSLAAAAKTQPKSQSSTLRMWLRDGWSLFRRTPWRLTGLLLVLFATEALLQVVLPVVGVVVSKIVVGVLAALFWLTLDHLDEHGGLRPRQALRRVTGRWPGLFALSCANLAVLTVQVAVGAAVLGEQGVRMLLFSDMGALRPTHAQLALVFASGVPIASLLMFAAPLYLLRGLGVRAALRDSAVTVLRNWQSIGGVMAISLLSVILAPSTFLLSVFLIAPWLCCVSYVAYRDLHPGADAIAGACSE